MLRDTLTIQQRVRGEGHISTLRTADAIATLLVNAGQTAEAEAVGRGTLAHANRTLGPDHTTSHQIACTLAITLGNHGQAEAEALFTATLATQQRVQGLAHPHTQQTEHALQRFQQQG